MDWEDFWKPYHRTFVHRERKGGKMEEKTLLGLKSGKIGGSPANILERQLTKRAPPTRWGGGTWFEGCKKQTKLTRSDMGESWGNRVPSPNGSEAASYRNGYSSLELGKTELCKG